LKWDVSMKNVLIFYMTINYGIPVTSVLDIRYSVQLKKPQAIVPGAFFSAKNARRLVLSKGD
jgi:hypothetical protein